LAGFGFSGASTSASGRSGLANSNPEIPAGAAASARRRKENGKHMESSKEPAMKALVVYYSASGNTEKVAHAIHESLLEEKVKSTLLKVRDAEGEELYDYDLVFLGSPSIEFLPAAPVMKFIKNKMNLHRKRGDIKLCAPRMPGKTAIVFCTYSGPHTGINEATTAGKYMAQFLEHIGFGAAHEWYVVGEFHGWPEANTLGRLGDIRGRPDAGDLSRVRSKVLELAKAAHAGPGASS
jgi:flavodoxin